MYTLDANSAVPLYEQLRIALLEMIDTKLIHAGERLPSEDELCSRYNVSRITVRRAINELETSGVLERRRGKGTFVAAKGRRYVLMPVDDVIGGFTDAHTGATEKSTEVISKEEFPANSFECEILKLDKEKKEKVLVLTRLMKVDGHPWMLDRTKYSQSRFNGFFDYIHDNVSTYKILRDKYQVEMTRSHKEFSLAYADSQQAKLFGCPVNSPLFKMFKVVYDRQGVPVHMSTVYFLADSVAFAIDSEIGKAPKTQSEYGIK